MIKHTKKNTNNVQKTGSTSVKKIYSQFKNVFKKIEILSVYVLRVQSYASQAVKNNNKKIIFQTTLFGSSLIKT